MKQMLIRLFVAIMLISPFIPASVHAQVPGIIPFGGRSLSTIFCGCSGCTLMFIGVPGLRPGGPGPVMYCPGVSRLYMHYNIFPPAWQLGIATGYRACRVPCWRGCCFVGGGPVILKDGTSVL